MAAAQTPEQFLARLEQWRTTVPIVVQDAVFQATNTLYGNILYRIFNEGNAADNKSIGTYSKQYKVKREKLGRQSQYKDFEVDGTLRRAIQVGIQNGKAVIGILPVGRYGKYNAADVSGFLETQIGGRVVFGASEKEKAAAEKSVQKYISANLFKKK